MFFSLALLVSSLDPLGTASQGGSYCLPADSTSGLLMRAIARMTSATTGASDADVRDSLRLTASGSPTLITNNAVCKKASTAYQAAVAGSGGSFSGSVYALQAGTRYVVLDPAFRYGGQGAQTVIVFDSRWKKVSVF